MIGRGGMGAIYEATHLVTRRKVALKVLHRWVIKRKSNGRAAERFLREARIASAIKHPGIADVFDAGEDKDGSLYLALELLEGFDLDRALQLGGLELGTMVQIAQKVLEPLHAAHAHGVIHRDIKPANIFLCLKDGKIQSVKLLDFGLAKSLSKDQGITVRGTILGSLECMSPEQASAGRTDHRADLWGVGAVLFRAVSGRSMFEGDNQVEILHAIANTPAPAVQSVTPELPAALAKVIDCALQSAPADRYQSAKAMQIALANLNLEGRASRLLPASSPQRASAKTPVILSFAEPTLQEISDTAEVPLGGKLQPDAPTVELPNGFFGAAIQPTMKIAQPERTPIRALLWAALFLGVVLLGAAAAWLLMSYAK